MLAMMWWETIPGAVATVAAGLAGLIYLIKKFFDTAEWLRRLGTSMIDLASTDAWPNGSGSLPESLNEMYRRQGETHDAVKENSKIILATRDRLESYIVAHRADHGVAPGDEPFSDFSASSD